MAVVPDPSEGPQGQGAEVHVSSGGGFGLHGNSAGDLLPRAVEQLGSALTHAGDLYGKTAALQSSNDFMDQTNKLLYGDPNKPQVGPNGLPVMGPDGKPMPDTGFLGKTGADAATARPQVRQQIDTIRQNLRGGLTTLDSLNQYDEFTRRNQAYVESQIGKHADSQYKTWAENTYKTTIDTQLANIAQNAQDMDAVHHSSDVMVTAAKTQARLLGLAPGSDAENDVVRGVLAKGIVARADAISIPDPKLDPPGTPDDQKRTGPGAAIRYLDGEGQKRILGQEWAKEHERFSNKAEVEGGAADGLDVLQKEKQKAVSSKEVDPDGTFTSFPPGAVAWNPKTGKALFPAKTNADGSPAPPGATSPADVARDNAAGTADIARREAGGAGTSTVTPDTIANAIHGQESGGRATSVTSVDNAHGGWQITPATFKSYAQPGESIDNPKDNEAVGRRIVADLSKRYNNDPARVAVAYFSGPDNVAPAGSPTPWKTDAADGNGKRTSSYVSDVLKRLGQPVPQGFASNAPPAGHDVMGAAGPRPRITDEDLTFSPSLISSTPETPPPNNPLTSPVAEGGQQPRPEGSKEPAPAAPTGASAAVPGAEVPVPVFVPQVDPYVAARQTIENDPTKSRKYKDAALSAINERHVTDQLVYTDQERAQRLYHEAVRAASEKAEKEIIEDLTSGKAVNTVQTIGQNKALTPEAQLRMIGFAKSVNSGEGEASAAVSGATTVRLMQDIGRPFGDPQKLTNVGPVIDAFNNHKLSRPDFEFLSKQIQQARSPEGEKLASAQTDFIKRVTPVIDKSNPLMGSLDPDGSMQLYRFTFDANEQIQYYMQHGKNPFDLFNPNKPDYLGSKENLAKYMTTMDQSIQSRVNQATGGLPATVGGAPPAPTPPLPYVNPLDRPVQTPGESFSAYRARVDAYISARQSVAPESFPGHLGGF